MRFITYQSSSSTPLITTQNGIIIMLVMLKSIDRPFRVHSSLRFATYMAWLLDTHNISHATSPFLLTSKGPLQTLKPISMDTITSVETSSTSTADIGATVSGIDRENEGKVTNSSSGSSTTSLNCFEAEEKVE